MIETIAKLLDLGLPRQAERDAEVDNREGLPRRSERDLKVRGLPLAPRRAALRDVQHHGVPCPPHLVHE